MVLLWIVLGVVLAVIILGEVRTFLVQRWPEQKEFLKGKVPSPLPDGFYKGNLNNPENGWQGKSFEAKNATGINHIKKNGKESRLFPFKMYVGKGIQDQNLEVLKIDYGETRPAWARLILDEVVEVSYQKYLGKVHLKLIPGLPFTVGYFRLEK